MCVYLLHTVQTVAALCVCVYIGLRDPSSLFSQGEQTWPQTLFDVKYCSIHGLNFLS